MAADYVARIRTVQPSGPYHLLGWSFGGTVAQEMAVQLQAAGEQVAVLVILDSIPSAPGRAGGLPVEDPLEASDIASVEAREAEIFGAASQSESATYRQVLRNNIRLLLEHRPNKVEGDVLFVSSSETNGSGRAAWRPYVSGRIQESAVACPHRDMYRPHIMQEIWEMVEGRLKA
jgi:thioesterase domain-containing protein